MMDCPTCREVLSAALDGEATATERRAADEHRSTCPACAAFADALPALRAELVERSAGDDAVPDLVPAVLASMRPVDADDTLLWRCGLAMVAVAQLLAAAVHLDGAHLARDQAAWEAALAAGFAWASWKPWRATGLLPMSVVLSVLLLANAGLSAGAGGVHHLLAPLGTVFLVLATRARPTLRPAVA
jgi:predicted anti-sigma-YlaC factor YlaD